MVESQNIPKGLPNIVRYFSKLFKNRMIADVESGKSEISIISHTGRKVVVPTAHLWKRSF